MALVPPTSTVSGVDYRVDRVNGEAPTSDAAFDGQVTLSLTYDPPDAEVRHEQEIRGVGKVSDGGIFVNEKDERGKDMRRWRVQRRDDQYVARQGLY